VNHFSFGNTDAKFDPVDRKAICTAACETNEKTLSVFGQNFFDSAASRRQLLLTNGGLFEAPLGRASGFTLTSAISPKLKTNSGYSDFSKDRLVPSHVACSQRAPACSMGGKTHFLTYPGPGTLMTRSGEEF
jgi:hypothetical protein